jgi:hypothetical protein
VPKGEKNIMFLAETVPKLQFLWSFHLFVIMQPDMWVQHERSGGSELCEKSFQLSSLLIVCVSIYIYIYKNYSIDRRLIVIDIRTIYMTFSSLLLLCTILPIFEAYNHF